MCERFGFDLNDSTKMLPEEVVPPRELGRLVLNRNTDNFFAETEQSAFHPGNVVPGIGFSNDPLLHGRLFSYSDAQTYRLGANRNQLPINAPKCPILYNAQEGASQMYIKRQISNYFPNLRDSNAPIPTDETPEANWEYAENKPITHGCPFSRGFHTFPGDKNFELSLRTVLGKVRGKPPTFYEHFAQATMFWNSLADWEKSHVISAFAFELGAVKDKEVRGRFINRILANIDQDLAQIVSVRAGVPYNPQLLHIDDDHPIRKYNLRAPIHKSPAISMGNQPYTPAGRKCAIYCCNGIVKSNLDALRAALTKLKVVIEVIGT
uniref:catalase n=1 Tax=Lygus hesperus TaxID=30085 RepID=A0A0A9Y4C3_LYGHE